MRLHIPEGCNVQENSCPETTASEEDEKERPNKKRSPLDRWLVGLRTGLDDMEK
jgi:hypothetical protein